MDTEKTDGNQEITKRLDHLDDLIHGIAADTTETLTFIRKWTPVLERFASPFGGFLSGKRKT